MFHNLSTLRKYLVEEQGISEAADCSEAELALIADMVSEMGSDGNSLSLTHLLEEDFVRAPPTLEEFIESSYYLGDLCRATDDAPGLFPKWREVLIELLADNTKYKQLILAGGIGLGKSFVASIIVLYKLCRALCMRSPLNYYGMIRSTTLNFSYFSVTQDQVIGGTFMDTVNLMIESPFFIEHIKGHNPRKRYKDGVVSFNKNIRIEAGSQIHEALGRNTLVALIDEVNFRREKNAYEAAAELLNAIEKRYKSRFRHVKDGLIILISSAKAEADFLAAHIKKVRNDPTVMVCDFPWWEVAGPVRISYSGITFPVDIGDNISPASILQAGEEKNYPPHRILKVPVEHLTDFEEDLDRAIRDVGGVSTGRVAKLFPSILPLINCIRDDVPNPFLNEIIRISMGNKLSIVDCLRNGGLDMLSTFGNATKPKRHPHMPRFIHIDISSGAEDNLGLAMVHPVARRQVERTDLRTQMKEIIMQPIFEADFVVGLRRDTPSDPIDFGKIRSFIWWLKTCGYNIQRITCDLRLLSEEMRNILIKMGFRASYLSVDRTKNAYEAFRYVIMEGRLRIAEQNCFIMEMANLEDGNDKIDHPPKFNVPWDGAARFGYSLGSTGSKDLGDSVCGAVYNAITDLEIDSSLTLPDLNEELERAASYFDPKTRLKGFIPEPTEIMVIE